MSQQPATLVRGGYVATFDPEVGDLRRADVLVRDGAIAAIGPDLDAGDGAAVIDAQGKVVLPGLVDTHRHVWQSAVAGSGATLSLRGYITTIFSVLAPLYEPDDVYAGVLWGALQALNAGVTTVADWSHIVTTPAHADANVQALRDAGIRGLFLYGPPAAADAAAWLVDSELPHPDDVRRVRSEQFATADGRLSMGLALRGPQYSTWDVTRHDFELARELDLPISIHCGHSGAASRFRAIKALEQLGQLGPDVNYAHANLLSDEEYGLIAASGGSISACPTVDLLMGIGTYSAAGRALEHGVSCGLSIDTAAAAGTDLFSEMRLALASERARACADLVAADEAVLEVAHDQRDMVRLATLDAERAWHLDDAVGSLAVGKRADLIVIDTSRPHLQPLNDPITTVVFNAGAADVETVMVEGEIVKRDGRLVGSHVARAQTLIEASRSRLAARGRLDEKLGPNWAA